MWRRKFGEPVPGEPTLPGVALRRTMSAISAGVAEGVPSRKSATAPATCGDAIDVPLIEVEPVLFRRADVIELPGAKTSTQVP